MFSSNVTTYILISGCCTKANHKPNEISQHMVTQTRADYKLFDTLIIMPRHNWPNIYDMTVNITVRSCLLGGHHKLPILFFWLCNSRPVAANIFPPVDIHLYFQILYTSLCWWNFQFSCEFFENCWSMHALMRAENFKKWARL